MKIKMPHKFLPESVAMPLACKNEDTALGLFQVTQSCYHYALKITCSLHLLSEITWFFRENLDHMKKNDILQITFTYFCSFCPVTGTAASPNIRIGCKQVKIV